MKNSKLQYTFKNYNMPFLHHKQYICSPALAKMRSLKSMLNALKLCLGKQYTLGFATQPETTILFLNLNKTPLRGTAHKLDNLNRWTADQLF